MKILRPMLAYSKSVGDILDKLTYPLYVSAKFDGVRCIIQDGRPVSRTLKPIPNKHINRALTDQHLPDGLEGELITYDLGGKMHDYNDVQSRVMSADGLPIFHYHIFDYMLAKDMPYAQRYVELQRLDIFGAIIKLVTQIRVEHAYEIPTIEETILRGGFEGLILRSPTAPYKFGRSTFAQQYLLKLKRFVDSEARIVGMKELMHNCNVAELDERGYTKRASHLDSQYGSNMMGCLIVEDIHHPEWGRFDIGTGFTDIQRKQFWNTGPHYTYLPIKYKYQSHGMKEKPRSPVFMGFRNKIDL